MKTASRAEPVRLIYLLCSHLVVDCFLIGLGVVCYVASVLAERVRQPPTGVHGTQSVRSVKRSIEY